MPQLQIKGMGRESMNTMKSNPEHLKRWTLRPPCPWWPHQSWDLPGPCLCPSSCLDSHPPYFLRPLLLHKASQPTSAHDSCSRQGLYYDFTVHLFISHLLPDVKLLEDWKQFLDAVKCTGPGTETRANAWLSPMVVLRPWVSRCLRAWLPHLSIRQQSSLPGGKMKWDNRCKSSGHLVISWTFPCHPSQHLP